MKSLSEMLNTCITGNNEKFISDVWLSDGFTILVRILEIRQWRIRENAESKILISD